MESTAVISFTIQGQQGKYGSHISLPFSVSNYKKALINKASWLIFSPIGSFLK